MAISVMIRVALYWLDNQQHPIPEARNAPNVCTLLRRYPPIGFGLMPVSSVSTLR